MIPSADQCITIPGEKTVPFPGMNHLVFSFVMRYFYAISQSRRLCNGL